MRGSGRRPGRRTAAGALPVLAPALAPILALVLVLGGSGCASYSDSFRPIAMHLTEHRPEAALAVLERRTPARRDEALYWLNRALLLRMTGQYAASNDALAQAEAVMGSLEAFSASEQTARFVLNDATAAYLGEPFERVLIPVYAALNHLALAAPEAARVELMRMDLRVRELAAAGTPPPWDELPFARYLSGVLFEALGEPDAALVAYRQAHRAYRAHTEHYPVAVPEPLRQDLLRLSARLGVHEEHAAYREAFGVLAPPAAAPADTAEVVLIVEHGLVPAKHELGQTTVDPHTGLLLRISLPYYPPRQGEDLPPLELVAGEARAPVVPVADLGALARHSLEARMPAITARAFARAVVKYRLAAQARQNGDNGLASLAANLTATLTERADTRSWLSLPAAFGLARLRLPAGRHHLRLQTADGRLLYRLNDAELRAGQLLILTPQRFAPPILPGAES